MLLSALLICALRITDVSIGTLRVLYVVRGQRLKAVLLGLVESGVFILAISRVMAGLTGKPDIRMLGYALGFAAGTYVGMTIERWIGTGWVLVRAISREHGPALLERLRDHQFGVTVLKGEGREGEILVFFIVAPRKRGDELLELIKATDADAFVTVDSVNHAIGGYIPHVATPATSVRK
jgi:uncharacterized protein YebE (UPF0316 family)